MKHFPTKSKALLAAFLVAGLTGGAAVAADAHGNHDKDVRVVRTKQNGKTKKAVVRGIPHPGTVRVVQAHPQFGRVDFGVYRRGTVWIARPAAPRAFVGRRGRVTVVRPVPIWSWAPARRGVSVNVHFRNDDACGAVRYSNLEPQYGCPFCDAGFASYGTWERHARGCSGGHVHGRVAFETWDAGDLDYFYARLELSRVFG